MSTTEPGTALEADAIGSSAPVVEERSPTFESSIVPHATIAGRSLLAVVAIMTFLASITAGAVSIIRDAAGEWQSDVAREITIQIRPIADHDIETELAKVIAITRAFPGIGEVRPYSREETTRLLEQGADPGQSIYTYNSWDKLLLCAGERGYRQIESMLARAMKRRFNYTPDFDVLKGAIIARDSRKIGVVLRRQPSLARASCP